MKLIVSGASGFVGSEVVRQSLADPRITSLIALTRKPMEAPKALLEGADASKFRNVVVKDYGTYSDEVRKEFARVDACIWYMLPLITFPLSLPHTQVHLRKIFCTNLSSGSEFNTNTSNIAIQTLFLCLFC